MKRRYAVPAAIALTAHALLFMGTGKPPTLVAPSTTPTEKNPWEIELKPIPPDVEDRSDTHEDRSAKMLPEIPEIPPNQYPRGPEVMTQPFEPVHPNHEITKKGVDIGKPSVATGAIEVSKLDNAPRTRFQKAPVYPHAMKASGTSGTVWVEFVVDEMGRVHDVRVLKSTSPGFEEATLTAVALWRFEPGKHKGIPVRFRMSLPVVFSLNE